MFRGLRDGWDLIVQSVLTFNRYPTFLIPLLLSWVVYAPTVVYFRYRFDWEAYTLSQNLLIILGVIFVFAFLLSFSCSILLEQIQQVESGRPVNFFVALWDTLGRNLFRMLPIVVVWTIIWFLLLLLEAVISKDSEEKRRAFNPEEALRFLAGYHSFTLSESFIDALQKGIRMIVFLILPAIAWEELRFWQATKKGLAVFRTHLAAFVSGFVLTEIAAVILVLPPLLFHYACDELGIEIRDWMWVGTFLYLAFVWSYTIYLEQMFTAELYLWNHKWEMAAVRAQQQGGPVPALDQIAKPSVLDGVYELAGKA